MSLLTINLGDEVKLTATFTDEASGALVDPTTVLITVYSPRQKMTTLTQQHPSLGVYTAVFQPTHSGSWHVRVAGTGAVKGAIEGVIDVNLSPSE